MATNGRRLVEELKGAVTRVGTRGVQAVVDGTVAAMKTMDKLQAMLPPVRERVRRVVMEELPLEMRRARAAVEAPPRAGAARKKAPRATKREKVPRAAQVRPSQVVRATVTEARQEQARTAAKAPRAKARRAPAQRAAEAGPQEPQVAGRKTVQLQPPAARRASQAQGRARASSSGGKKGGFKVKRGQKHRHNR